MLDLKILGFLADGPLHGYELRRRVNELDGPGSCLSEGSLYPALARMEKDGLLTRQDEPGARGRARRTVSITSQGRERLHSLLRDVAGPDLESQPRFLVVLAFLSHLPDPRERRAVLQRRMEVLSATPPAFFFNDDGGPRRSQDETDPYRRAMVQVAAASRRAETRWLQETLSTRDDLPTNQPEVLPERLSGAEGQGH